jgi:glucose-6-phosphate isomerase
MLEYMLPFSRSVDLATGKFVDALRVQQRRLSDLKGLYADPAAEAALMSDDPLVYEVYEASNTPVVVGQLGYSTTIIYPGKVGDEYFFTKGHYHALGDRAELYYGLLGEGYLQLQTPEGKVEILRMTPGVAAYVPPYWGHRTMNVGKENFAFLACYPADAGYDYATIAEKGFAQIVAERDSKPTLVDNPKWKK